MEQANFVRIFEVGPRDGLQNEKNPLTPQLKAELVNRLAAAGLRHIESGSFVSPKWVPQMANSDEVFQLIERRGGTIYSALTPNLKGYQLARAAQADEVAVFAAASETFSQKNINCSIEESLDRFRPLMEAAQQDGIPVRGYISCVLGCPYEGAVDPSRVAELAASLIAMGCYEVSLGDTIGVGTPNKAARLIQAVSGLVDTKHLAVHFHDTYGQAIANIYACLEEGVRCVDSSVAGLGGCPYAPGAGGNVATEDVVYLLQGCGYETGVDLNLLSECGHWISLQLNRPTGSKVATALNGQCARQ